MLASTLIPQPQSMSRAPLEEDVNMSFGRFVHFAYFHYLLFSVYLFSIMSLDDILNSIAFAKFKFCTFLPVSG